jgi:uncharacterized protein YndB with AHSA1/START domain
MTTTTTTAQVYRIYIKAPAEKIWQAITDPEWTNQYGYTGYAHYDLRPGGKFEVVPNEEFKAGAAAQGYPVPELVVDGEVVECDPPRKLVTTWCLQMDPGMAAEGHSRLTYEIEPLPDGSACRLTVTHDDLDDKPMTAAMVAGEGETQGAGGGHAWVLSDLKSLLETGSTLAGSTS